MQLLGYAHGIIVITPSDISPDMYKILKIILSGLLKSKKTNKKNNDLEASRCALGLSGFTAINP